MRLTLFFGCLALCAIAFYFLPGNVDKDITYPTNKEVTAPDQANAAPALVQSSQSPILHRTTTPTQTSGSAGILECTVIDSAGAPVPEAVITLISEENQMSEYTANEEGIAVIEMPRLSKGAVLAKKANLFGEERTSDLTAFHVEERQSLLLTLTQKSSSLMGIVYAGGAPAADVRVIVTGKPFRVEKTTDAMGIFQFSDLPSNKELAILCIKNRLIHTQNTITLAPSETTLVTYDIGSSRLTVNLDLGVHTESLEKTVVSLSPVHSWKSSYDTLRAFPKDGVASFYPISAGEYFLTAKIPWSPSNPIEGYCTLSSTISIDDDSATEVSLECSGHSKVELFSTDSLVYNLIAEYWFEFPDTSYSRDYGNYAPVMFRQGKCQPINAPATPCKLFLNYSPLGIVEIPLDLVADEFVSIEVSFPTSNILVSVSDIPEWGRAGDLILQNEKGQFICSRSLTSFTVSTSFGGDPEPRPTKAEPTDVELGRVPVGSYRVGLMAGAKSSWSEFMVMNADTNVLYWD